MGGLPNDCLRTILIVLYIFQFCGNLSLEKKKSFQLLSCPLISKIIPVHLKVQTGQNMQKKKKKKSSRSCSCFMLFWEKNVYVGDISRERCERLPITIQQKPKSVTWPTKPGIDRFFFPSSPVSCRT